MATFCIKQCVIMLEKTVVDICNIKLIIHKTILKSRKNMEKEIKNIKCCYSNIIFIKNELECR